MDRRALAAVLVAALGVAAFLLLRRDTPPPPDAGPASVVRPPPVAPALQGTAPPATPPVEAPRVAAPPAAESAGPTARSVESLVEEIRARVEPAYWQRTPNAVMEARNGVIIARASPDVLDAVQAYLVEERRRLAPDDVVVDEDPPPDPVASEELRALLRAMLDRQLEWTDVSDRLASDRDAARRSAEVVIPADDAASRGPRLKRTPRHGTLLDWIRGWPVSATTNRASELAARAGYAPIAGAARDDALRRGSISFRMDGAPLWAVLRRIQIESFADVVVASGLEALTERGMPATEVVGRPLQTVLDDLLRALPSGHRWTVEPSRIVLTSDAVHTTAAPPRLRYFDVRDLLEPPR
jgi:hypothetical protein